MSQKHRNRKRAKGEHLNYSDRIRLEVLVKQNERVRRRDRLGQREMAEELGTSAATVCRELKRGAVKLLRSDLIPYQSYSADIAQDTYDWRASGKGRPLKLGNDWAFTHHVEERIVKQGYSPDSIIMELRVKGNPFKTKICTTTLYSYLHSGVFPGVTGKDLRRRGRRVKRQYRRIRPALYGKGRPIEERPKTANNRTEYGHWEMDCITSGVKQGSACLLTLVERMTREPLIFKLCSHTQQEVIRVLNKLEKQDGHRAFRNKFKSITVDNGHEFLNHQAMETSHLKQGRQRTTVYFAHPYCSCERGSIEHLNGMIRWFIPKGSNIAAISPKQIAKIQQWLLDIPRRSLGGQSAGSALAKARALPALT